MKFIVTVFLFLICATFISAEGERITFDDLYSMPRAHDPEISPDGEHIAFVLTTRDPVAGESSSHIWLMNPDGSDLRQLTNGENGESSPRWSPDGKSIAFVANRGDGSQLFTIAVDGGEAQQVTSISTGVSTPVWSPDGKTLMFSSRVFPDCRSDSCNKAKLDERENAKVKARVYDHLMFRHYKYWFDGMTERIFLYDFEDDISRQLTFTHDNAPISSIGGHDGFVFSPDGSEICYKTNTDSIPALSTNSDLFVMPITGGDPVRITPNRGADMYPQYSPNGEYISYLSMARAGYESDQTDIFLYNRLSGERRNLTKGFDRSVWRHEWTPDSKSIIFLAIEYGFEYVWRLDVESGTVEKLLGDAVYYDLAMSQDGKYIVVSKSLSDEPYELYRYDLGSKELTRLTHFTDEIVSRLDMHRANEFWFEGFNGDSVHGFFTLPPDFDHSRQYPLVLLIHGGPQWCWLGDFNYYGWNSQLMAAQDYIVAQIDPHGSAGYGLAFKEYVSGNWGRGDYEDLMMGVDYLIENIPYIDSTRMAALGRSYGGFMTNWICGHTDRFKCLVTIDGTFNHVAEYGSTDELWFPEWEFKGTPWTNREEYIRSSPSSYVQNFKTPTLVIHGELDYRVDPSEAFQMYTSLQRMGVPSELIYYPDEGHSIHKLHNLRHVYEKQLEWLEKWLR